MYKPRTYVRVMEFATALRTMGNRRYPDLLLVWKVLHLYDNLVERAYEVGHGEGYSEGKQDGRQEGREEVGCRRVTAEEWEARVSP